MASHRALLLFHDLFCQLGRHKFSNAGRGTSHNLQLLLLRFVDNDFENLDFLHSKCNTGALRCRRRRRRPPVDLRVQFLRNLQCPGEADS